MTESQKNLRIYVSLPTEDDPTPAFVLQNLAEKTPTFIRIERTNNGPGAVAYVGKWCKYICAM
jgi:hypothetical protein